MKGPPVFLTFHNSAQSVMSRLRVTTWPSRCPPLYKSMFNSKNFSLIRHTESVPCVQVCLQMLPRFVIPFSVKVHLCLFSNNFLALNVCWGHSIARLPRGLFDFDSTNSEIAREKKTNFFQWKLYDSFFPKTAAILFGGWREQQFGFSSMDSHPV